MVSLKNISVRFADPPRGVKRGVQSFLESSPKRRLTERIARELSFLSASGTTPESSKETSIHTPRGTKRSALPQPEDCSPSKRQLTDNTASKLTLDLTSQESASTRHSPNRDMKTIPQALLTGLTAISST